MNRSRLFVGAMVLGLTALSYHQLGMSSHHGEPQASPPQQQTNYHALAQQYLLNHRELRVATRHQHRVFVWIPDEYNRGFNPEFVLVQLREAINRSFSAMNYMDEVGREDFDAKLPVISSDYMDNTLQSRADMRFTAQVLEWDNVPEFPEPHLMVDFGPSCSFNQTIGCQYAGQLGTERQYRAMIDSIAEQLGSDWGLWAYWYESLDTASETPH